MSNARTKRLNESQNPVINGGLADDGHKLILPANTTANLAQIPNEIGSIAFDTSTNQVVVNNGSGFAPSGGGSGTVTSVGLTAPVEFTVTGSPVTGAGTLVVSKANQNANLIYSGPASGAAAAPTFRSLVASDIPVLNYANTDLSNLTSPTAVNETLNMDSGKTLHLMNEVSILGRNFSDTFDIPMIKVSSGDLVTVGDSSNSHINITPTVIDLVTNSSSGEIDANGLTFQLHGNGIVSPELLFWEPTENFATHITVPTGLAADYTLTLPLDAGTSGQVLSTDGSGTLSWATAGGSSSGVAGAMQFSNGSGGFSSDDANLHWSGQLGIGTNSTSGKLSIYNTTAQPSIPAISMRITEVPIFGWDFVHETASSGDLFIERLDGGSPETAMRISRATGNVLFENQVRLLSNATGFVTSFVASPTLAGDYTLTLPIDDGTTGQVLTTDGSGVLSWGSGASGAATTALDNLASTSVNADIIPDSNNSRALGSGADIWQIAWTGNVLSNTSLNIASGGAGPLNLTSASGNMTVSSDIQMLGQGGHAPIIALGDKDNNFTIQLQTPATLTQGTLYTLPATDGTDQQVMTTNGSGVMSWTNPMALLPSGSDPASPSAGWVYFNTVSNKIKVYNGTTWETVTSI